MNIIINHEEHELLQSMQVACFTIGSRLYGTAREDSDTDYLCLYETSSVELHSGLPNVHQFQYKDTITGTDWNYCSELQFWKNLHSGEATIHADIILFTDFADNKLELCHTYKIIKAYLGFARRDIKEAEKGNHKKALHAARGLYCAASLLENRLPSLTDIQLLYRQEHHKNTLMEQEQTLRQMASQQYDAGTLQNYYIKDCGHVLWQKMLQSNNTKEFRY